MTGFRELLDSWAHRELQIEEQELPCVERVVHPNSTRTAGCVPGNPSTYQSTCVSLSRCLFVAFKICVSSSYVSHCNKLMGRGSWKLLVFVNQSKVPEVWTHARSEVGSILETEPSTCEICVMVSSVPQLKLIRGNPASMCCRIDCLLIDRTHALLRSKKSVLLLFGGNRNTQFSSKCEWSHSGVKKIMYIRTDLYLFPVADRLP